MSNITAPGTYKQFFESYYIKVSDQPFENATEISDIEYKEVKHLFANKGDIESILNILINDLKITPSHAQAAARIIHSDDAAVLYLLDRDVDDNGVTLEELISAGNIYTPFEKREISRDTIQALYNLEPSTKPRMGKGEILVSVFIKNAKKASTGDVVIDDNLFDVKGESARIGGQKGFSGPAPGSITWHKELKKYSPLIKDLTDGFQIPPAGSNGYNLKRTVPFQFLAIIKLINEGHISEEEGIRIAKSGLLAVYTLLDSSHLVSVENLIKAKATPEAYKDFIETFSIEMLNYYLEIEDLKDTGLIVFNNRGSVVFLSYNEPNLLDKVNITLPAFSTKAGPQGAMTGISIKKARR
jgi:hypothetical protein